MTQDRPRDVGYGMIVTAVASLLVYALALRNGFAFDDVVLIPGDPRVTGAHIGQLLARPYWNDSTLGLYRPITSLSFGLDWYVSKGSAAWFHFTNMIWHALASVFAYALLTRFFRPAAALCGALVFAVHPVHVEAVANIVGRGELIAATFFFAACYAWTARSLAPAARVGLTAVCYALAMVAKEGTVVLPAILLLLDLVDDATPLRRHHWRGYAVLLGCFAIFMLLRWFVIGGLTPARLDPSIEVTTSFGQRLLTALQAWPVEMKLLLFPRTLLADYGPRILMPITAWTPLAVIGLTLVVATVAGGVVACARGSYLWALGLFWFPVTILPVSNFIIPIGVLVAERTLYLPSFALCFGIAAFLSPARTLSLARTRWLVAAIVLALAARTLTRIPDWNSTDSIMLALVRDRPDAFRGHWHRARMAREKKDPGSAVARYDHALKLWPYRESLVQEAAAYGGSHGRAAWARDVAFWGTRRWPENVNFHRMLAAQAVDLGDTVTARRAVANGLHLHPGDTILNQMRHAFGRPGTVE